MTPHQSMSEIEKDIEAAKEYIKGQYVGLSLLEILERLIQAATAYAKMQRDFTPCPKCRFDYNNDSHKIMRLIQDFNKELGVGIGCGFSPEQTVKDLLALLKIHMKPTSSVSAEEARGVMGWFNWTYPEGKKYREEIETIRKLLQERVG